MPGAGRAERVNGSIFSGYRSGAVRPIEQGGAQGTIEVATAVIDQL